MSKRRDQSDRLLADTFADGGSDAFLPALPLRAAATARRRRFARRAAALGASVAGLGLALFLARPGSPPSPPSPSLAVRAAPPASYEIIDDGELLAQLRDRSVVVLPTPDGGRRFIVSARN